MSTRRIGLETMNEGQEFPPTPLDLSREAVSRLLESLDAQLLRDTDRVELVPPSALASLSLAALLRHTALPDGSLHISQEIRIDRAIHVDSHAICSAVVSTVSNKAGLTFVSLDFSVAGSGTHERNSGEILATGSSTVMFPEVDA
jgi:hypothetical protein